MHNPEVHRITVDATGKQFHDTPIGVHVQRQGHALLRIVIMTDKLIPFVVSLSNHERTHSGSNLPFDKPVLS